MKIFFMALASATAALMIKNKSTGGLIEWLIIVVGIISLITMTLSNF